MCIRDSLRPEPRAAPARGSRVSRSRGGIACRRGRRGAAHSSAGLCRGRLRRGRELGEALLKEIHGAPVIVEPSRRLQARLLSGREYGGNIEVTTAVTLAVRSENESWDDLLQLISRLYRLHTGKNFPHTPTTCTYAPSADLMKGSMGLPSAYTMNPISLRWSWSRMSRPSKTNAGFCMTS